MKKTFQEEIKQQNDSFERKTDKIFKRFYTEIKRKGIKTILENNALWRQKYQPELDKIEKIHNAKYKKLWLKHFSK